MFFWFKIWKLVKTSLSDYIIEWKKKIKAGTGFFPLWFLKQNQLSAKPYYLLQLPWHHETTCLFCLFYSSRIVYLYVCIDISIYLSINLFIYIFISQGLRIYLNQAFKENLHLYLLPRKVTHITNKSNTWTDQLQQLWMPHAPGGGALRPHL